MLKKIKSLTKQIKNARFFSDYFMKADNSLYMETLYNEWLLDPKSVDISWQSYFANISQGFKSEESVINPDELMKTNYKPKLHNEDLSAVYIKLALLIKDFRTYGHYVSDIDPLKVSYGKRNFEELTHFFDLDTSILGKEYFDTEVEWDFPFLKNKLNTPREIHKKLTEIYCGKISFEYMYINNQKEVEWIRSKVETDPVELNKEEKLNLLNRILESQIFTNFSQRRFSTLKRFGIEGLDSAISGLGKMTTEAKKLGVKEIILGMAHRGRLNTLGCVFRKPYKEIFGEFEQTKGINKPSDKIYAFTGDVKYHSGTHHNLKFDDGYNMNITLLSNPSHLEVVNPVVLGNVKARQVLGNKTGKEIMPILIHGDAAFSGQGINYELQQLEKLKDFEVGGTIHIVFNNQIGFTTNPDKGRSNYHCTSIARLNKNFVIHVNAEEPELVDRALSMAVEYRNLFNRDVFVDIVGYRKFGHNEQDHPDFTQPIMYQKIRAMKPMYEKYIDKIVNQGLFTKEEIDQKIDDYMKFFNEEHKKGKNGEYEMTNGDFYRDEPYLKERDNVTGIENINDIGRKINTLPTNHTFHEIILKKYKNRLDAFASKDLNISFQSAESLAFASLANEGLRVRLSGVDVKKGIFNLRHAELIDQKTNESYFPIQNALSEENKDNFTVINSPLTEMAILGFEYGYSLAALRNLTIWQVGGSDYLNECEMILDQFVFTSEKKWSRLSGLVVLIPYSMNERHSENMNTYLERLLTNCGDNYIHYEKNEQEWNLIDKNENILVCNPTTSANYFHLLRGQVKNNYRKPLFLTYPENLQKNEKSYSPKEDFSQDKKFIKVIDDQIEKKSNVKKIIFCSGQFYYNLVQRRSEQKKDKEVAIIRLEKLGPFPYFEVNNILNNYSKDCKVVFAQEEHLNFGAFSYVEPRLNVVLKKLGFEEVNYAGKKVSAVTGYSFPSINQKNFDKIFEDLYK